jgi:sugar phosphate isomerase/epimerase
MIPGIKFGPRNWKEILKDYRPKVCEIWFRIDWVDRYEEMFAYLRREKIRTGLHFWGMLPGGIAPNFAFPDSDIRKPSVKLVKDTIDVASKFKFHYVNIHPGSYHLAKLNLDRYYMRPVTGRKTTPDEGEKALYENIASLDSYAKKRGVLLLTETIACREPMHWRDLIEGRKKTQDIQNVPVSAVETLAKKGFFVCNDFCHTAADIISSDREYIFKKLLEKTKRLEPQTKLIHVNTMPPPFNGTDGHLGILKQDFENDVFPSRKQLKKLLSLFVGRADVWAIPEPFSDHIENTLALDKLLEETKKEG